jgi:hypothetical protein
MVSLVLLVLLVIRLVVWYWSEEACLLLFNVFALLLVELVLSSERFVSLLCGRVFIHRVCCFGRVFLSGFGGLVGTGRFTVVVSIAVVAVQYAEF